MVIKGDFRYHGEPETFCKETCWNKCGGHQHQNVQNTANDNERHLITDLGNTDDFTTETLEWRLGCEGDINYSGNLMDPPFQSQKKFGATFTKLDKTSIRGKKYDSDSDDD